MGSRREENATGLSDAVDQRVQRIHRQRVKQSIGVRQRRSTDDRDRGPICGKLAREPLDARCGDAGTSSRPRRACRRPGPPTSLRSARPRGPRGGRQMQRVDHHVRDTQRQDAFGSRLDRNPFVGIRAGLRHSRFDLNEFPALAGPALPHLAVSDVLGHGRVPGSEKVGAERQSRIASAPGRRWEVARVRSCEHWPAEGPLRRKLRIPTAAERRNRSRNCGHQTSAAVLRSGLSGSASDF